VSGSLRGERVLVTGAGGRLGAELISVLQARGAAVTGVGRADFDLGGREAVHRAIERHRPRAIFHAAAWTAVDACEDDPDVAYRVNALGTRNVCEAAAIVGSRVIYISTDHVFSGEKASPYDEFDDPAPRNVYGRSKLWGERYVLALGPSHAVVRTSRLFGSAGRNYVISSLEKARTLAAGEPFVAVSDQLATPTYAPDLAAACVDLAERAGGGIYHLTSGGPPCSWAELATRTFEAAGLRVPVRAIHSPERPRRAARPANGVLANRVATLEGLPPLPSWTDALVRYVASLATRANAKGGVA
jgi:dTDP-4-dehydrorhamnose reductase